MIFGRPPALFAAAISAILNAIVLIHIVTLDAQQIAGLNVAAAAIIGLIAGTSLTDHAALAAAQEKRVAARQDLDKYK